MNVQKLKEYISTYKNFLKKDRELKEMYKWETLKIFQKNWDIEAPDFGKMYDACLQNSTTKRLWKKESWFPKEMMMKLIAIDPEFARRMFRSLFDEEKEVAGRISRFKFGADELLADYKKVYKNSIENNHFHDDSSILYFYLTCRFPEKYTFFTYNTFVKTVERLGVLDLPAVYDLERFGKLTNILNTFVKKDTELLELHQSKRNPEIHFTGDSRLIVHDFYQYVGQ